MLVYCDQFLSFLLADLVCMCMLGGDGNGNIYMKGAVLYNHFLSIYGINLEGSNSGEVGFSRFW